MYIYPTIHSINICWETAMCQSLFKFMGNKRDRLLDFDWSAFPGKLKKKSLIQSDTINPTWKLALKIYFDRNKKLKIMFVFMHKNETKIEKTEICEL